jgi:anti-sigma regulatory factor (Ser/Thr protein kinase)
MYEVPDTMSDTLSIALLNRTEELERLSSAIDEFADVHGFSADVTHAIHLALDEVVANVIRHAHDDGDEHRIGVELSLGNGIVTIEVNDDGVAFNPLAAPPPDLELPIEQRRPGGLGIHIIKAIMDGLDYRRSKGRNRLTMVKMLGRFDPGTAASAGG